MSVESLKTLVLTQGYEPVKVIPWQRAITLLSLGKIEVLEEHDHELRSTFLVIKCPAVVRLLSAFKRHKKPVKFSRVNIFGRDRYCCQYCGVEGKMSDLTYDHVVPRSQGGKTTWTNIVTACGRCNSKKAGRTPEQAGMKLKKKPVRPNWMPSMTIRISHRSAPAAWRDYLYWSGALDED